MIVLNETVSMVSAEKSDAQKYVMEECGIISTCMMELEHKSRPMLSARYYDIDNTTYKFESF